MARKDVDLVIRAKDEAESVVRAITKALNDFNDAQSSTEAKAGKTDTALGKLGAAFGSLQKATSGGTAFVKIEEEMRRAEGAMGRLEKSTGDAKTQLANLREEAATLEVSLVKLAEQTQAASKAQADQVKAVAKSKTELASLRLELNTLTQANASLVAAQSKLPESIAKQEAAIGKTVARLKELNAASEAATVPSKTLTDQIAKANERFVQQTAKLDNLKAELVGVGAKLATTGSDMAKFAENVAKAEKSLKGQTDNLAKVKSDYAGLSSTAKAAAQSQGTVAASIDRITGKLAAEEAQLQVASIAFVELSKAAGLADADLAKLSSQGVAKLQDSLSRQKLILEGAKQGYAELSQAASELEVNIGRAGVPTRKMAEDLAVLKAQVAGSGAVLAAARTGFLEMGQAFREGSTDLAGLEATEKTFVATQATVSASIAKATTEYNRNLVAIKALHAESAKTVNTRLPPPVPTAPPVQPWNQLSDAFNRLYGDSRKSLSLTQRLRGEVLSLVAAYGGFYGVVSILGQVLGAYQKLEAAQARLNVANSGDIVKSADDLDFLRRNAERLGVDLGTLATEFSKFSIATQGSSLAGEKTRKIFLSVAEAARVSRSSTEELSGVFVALTQIVSKGVVQSEELKQQLGDRLPGALQIMADGLHVTTAELVKMMEQGQITAEALVPFAEELDKRFGPGLGEALAGTTVAIGRLKNAAFEALVAFGKGGFIDAFTELANRLTVLLQSADFAAFLQSASTAAAGLVSVLTVLVDNFQAFVAIGTGFIGLKLAPVIIGIVASFGELALAARGAAATQLAVQTALGVTSRSAMAAATSVGVFRSALNLLTSSTGAGLAITAVATLIGYWAVSADDATTAMTEHKRIVDLVKNAYDETKGAVDKWQTAVTDVSVTAAKENLNQLGIALDATKTKFQTAINIFQVAGDNLFTAPSAGFNSFVSQTQKLFDEFKAGTRDAASLRTEVDRLALQYDTGSGNIHDFALELDKQTKILVDQKTAFDEAGLAVTAMTDKTKVGQDAFDQFGKVVLTSADAAKIAKDQNDKYAAAIAKITEETQRASGALTDLKSKADIEAAFKSAVEAARTMGQVADAVERANAALDALNQKDIGSNFSKYTSGVEASASLIRQKESFRSTPYYDVTKYRAGFGSDTITLSDGSIQDVVQGVRVSVADAERDLERRIGVYQNSIRDAIGKSTFDGMTPQQQAALTSITYNYGSLPDRIVEAIKSGKSDKEVADAIRQLGSDNGGVNQARRGYEASLFNSTDNPEIVNATLEKITAEKQKQDDLDARAKERADQYNTDLAQRNDEQQSELENQGKLSRETAVQKAIHDEIKKAKAAGVELTKEEIAKVGELAGKLFDQQHGEDSAQASAERANALYRERVALEKQIQDARSRGDNGAVDSLNLKLVEVNTQLDEAINKAEEMWKAIGGEAADTAIIKLEALRAKSAVTTGTMKTDFTSVKDLITNGVAGAFNSFAQDIANGVKPVVALRDAFLKFASDFLIQIAQMIIKQTILNILQKTLGGSPIGALIGLAHTGGVIGGGGRAGSGNGTRNVNPAMFAAAPRYHTGGIVGLAPNEIPIIAKKGEEVLTANDPRHSLNGGTSADQAQGAVPQKTKVVNLIDGPGVLEAALNSAAGERIILNWMRANADAVSTIRG